MNIIDTTHKFGYNQWIVDFTSKVLDNANIDGNAAIILGISNKCVYLSVDCQPYTIRMNNFLPTKKDPKHMTCRENIEYSLYINDGDYDANPKEEVSSGIVSIEWDNDPMLFKSDFRRYGFFDSSKDWEGYQIEDQATLYIYTVHDHDFYIDLNLSSFTSEEREFISYFYGMPKTKPIVASNNTLQLAKVIERKCVAYMLEKCFDGSDFDLNYTHWLLRCCSSNKLCSRKRMIEEENTLNRLYDNYKKGDHSALNAIQHSLYEFIRVVRPFCAVIDPE